MTVLGAWAATNLTYKCLTATGPASKDLPADSYWKGVFQPRAASDPYWAKHIKAYGPQLYDDLKRGIFQEAYGEAAGLTWQQQRVKDAIQRCVDLSGAVCCDRRVGLLRLVSDL